MPHIYLGFWQYYIYISVALLRKKGYHQIQFTVAYLSLLPPRKQPSINIPRKSMSSILILFHRSLIDYELRISSVKYFWTKNAALGFATLPQFSPFTNKSKFIFNKNDLLKTTLYTYWIYCNTSLLDVIKTKIVHLIWFTATYLYHLHNLNFSSIIIYGKTILLSFFPLWNILGTVYAPFPRVWLLGRFDFKQISK